MVQVWHEIQIIVQCLLPANIRVIVHSAIGEGRDERLSIWTFVVRGTIQKLFEDIAVVEGVYLSWSDENNFKKMYAEWAMYI